MIKDTFFSAPRFKNLCCKEMVENWKTNLLRLLLLYGAMSIVLIWKGCLEYSGRTGMITDNAVNEFSLISFMFFLWGFGCLSASFTMEPMKSKTNRLSVLMTPATNFEKYFSRWLIYTIVFLIVFLISFKLADYTRVLVCSLLYPKISGIHAVNLTHLIGHTREYYTVFRTSLEFLCVLSGYFFFQSCFVLGSSIWPRNSFLKTFVTGVIVTIVYGLVAFFLGKALLDNGNSYSYGRDMTKETLYTIMIYVSFSFAFLNWILAYFRFKESEIIHRM